MAALSITGNPIFWEATSNSSSPMVSWMPGTTGHPAAMATSRAAVLDPIFTMHSGRGPMKVMPAAWKVRAASAFSDRNP